MEKHLLVDTANILFRVASAHTKYNTAGTPEEQAGLALHMALMTLKSHYNKVKPDRIALTFEGGQNWRKDYTKSEQCISGRVYKANRVRDDSMIPFFELIASFEKLVREHTSLTCLSHPLVEGDDLFCGYTRHFTGLGHEVVGLSGDKDFVQMLKYPGFTLLNPDKLGAERNKDKKGNLIDPEFFMFEKAFRGDTGDNVMPAYPRVRSTRLMKAFTDEYERTNIMNETWTFTEPSTGIEKVFRVGDLYEENQLLMNLDRQPPHIVEIIDQTVQEGIASRGKFNLFAFQKFCGKYELRKISEDVTSFVQMFSLNGQKVIQEVPQQIKKSTLVF